MIVELALVLACAGEPRFEEVAFSLSTKSADEGVAGMRAWADAHNGTDDGARALLWLSRKQLERNDRTASRAALVEAAPRDEAAVAVAGRYSLEALRLLAAMDIDDLALDDAEREAGLLALAPDARQSAAGQRMLEELVSRRHHRWLYVLVLALLVVDVVTRFVLTRRPVAVPFAVPFEVQLVAPVLALLALLGLVKGVKELPALVLLAVAGSLLAWARGAHRSARPLASIKLRAADAAFALVETLALAWVVFDGTGLMQKLELFFTAGPG